MGSVVEDLALGLFDGFGKNALDKFGLDVGVAVHLFLVINETFFFILNNKKPITGVPIPYFLVLFKEAINIVH